MKSSFVAFVNEKLANDTEERKLVRQMSLNNTQIFVCDPKDKKQRLAKWAAALEKRLVSHLRKQFEGTGDEGPSISDSDTWVQLKMYMPS